MCGYQTLEINQSKFDELLAHIHKNIHKKIKLYIDNGCIIGIKYDNNKYTIYDSDGNNAPSPQNE